MEQPLDLWSVAERFAARAESFIAEEAAAERPFFVYLALTHTHVPRRRRVPAMAIERAGAAAVTVETARNATSSLAPTAWRAFVHRTLRIDPHLKDEGLWHLCSVWEGSEHPLQR